MIAESEVRASLARHRRFWNGLDRDAWLANFVEEPYLEEPVGTAVMRGRENFARAIDAAIVGAARSRTIKLNEPLAEIVNGDRAALYFTAVRGDGHSTTLVEAIEEFQIAEDGRIAGIRAFLHTADTAALTR